MPNSRRVAVTLSDSLLTKVDQIVRREKGSRSQFIREAMLKLVAEREKERIASLGAGYRKMGSINLKLAEEAISEDNEDFNRYEAKLAGDP